MACHGGPNIVEDNLILCLDAANTKSYPSTGATWTDISGTGNNGTLIGSPTYSSNNGGYFDLDGTEYIKLPIADDANFGSYWSFDMWVYLDRDSVDTQTYANYYSPQGLFTMSSEADWNGGTSTNSGFAFGWNKVHYKQDGGSTQTYLSWTGPSVRTWHHFGMTLNNGTGTSYINGVSVASATNFQDSFDGSSGQKAICITDTYNSTVRGRFEGYISNFKFYTKTLSAVEVKQNYNAQKGRYGL